MRVKLRGRDVQVISVWAFSAAPFVALTNDALRETNKRCWYSRFAASTYIDLCYWLRHNRLLLSRSRATISALCTSSAFQSVSHVQQKNRCKSAMSVMRNRSIFVAISSHEEYFAPLAPNLLFLNRCCSRDQILATKYIIISKISVPWNRDII